MALDHSSTAGEERSAGGSFTDSLNNELWPIDYAGRATVPNQPVKQPNSCHHHEFVPADSNPADIAVIDTAFGEKGPPNIERPVGVRRLGDELATTELRSSIGRLPLLRLVDSRATSSLSETLKLYSIVVKRAVDSMSLVEDELEFGNFMSEEECDRAHGLMLALLAKDMEGDCSSDQRMDMYLFEGTLTEAPEYFLGIEDLQPSKLRHLLLIVFLDSLRRCVLGKVLGFRKEIDAVHRRYGDQHIEAHRHDLGNPFLFEVTAGMSSLVDALDKMVYFVELYTRGVKFAYTGLA